MILEIVGQSPVEIHWVPLIYKVLPLRSKKSARYQALIEVERTISANSSKPGTVGPWRSITCLTRVL